MATHKITEAVALGGAGGCIPLFVLPTKHRVESMLPYTRWLDYCSIAYVVREADVPRLAAVIDELRALPTEETEAKRAARKWRDTSAADYARARAYAGGDGIWRGDDT